MVLVDTPVWVEFLQGTGSPADEALRVRIEDGTHLVTVEPVVLELLAGAGDEARADELRRMLLSFDCRPTAGLEDAMTAAAIYRACRRRGHTARSLTDCLIAAVALREGIPLLTTDPDFEAIAAETGLELVRA